MKYDLCQYRPLQFQKLIINQMYKLLSAIITINQILKLYYFFVYREQQYLKFAIKI